MYCIFLSNQQRSIVTLGVSLTKVFSIELHSILKCLSSMFPKIYLIIAIVLRCCKKCSSFLWCFDGNCPVFICSQFIFKTKMMCICFCGTFRLVKIANWFSFLNASLQLWPENILGKHSCFFCTLEKIKQKSSLAASSDFTVTSRRLVVYTGDQIFPIVIMLVFRTKFYM